MTDTSVDVGFFSDAMAAHLARARLEAEGIEAHVYDQHMVTNEPLLSGALGGVKVAVAASDAEAARRLLADKHAVEASTCPRCDSTQIERLELGRRAAFLTIISLGFPIGRTKSSLRCEECEHRWRE